MDDLFQKSVSSATLRNARSSYEESGDEESRFYYGSCLVRTESDANINRGISLLKDVYSSTLNNVILRNSIEYIVVGYFRLKEYGEALRYVEIYSSINPYMAREMKSYINAKRITTGIVTGAAILGGAALLGFGIYKLAKAFTTDSEEPPQPAISWNDNQGALPWDDNQGATGGPIINEVSSSDEEESVCDQLTGVKLGSEINQWQQPITKYSNIDSGWLPTHADKMDFGRREWDRAHKAVTKVLNILREELTNQAKDLYKGLRIDSYILQGSSRDGLKVIAPDEFDIGIEFHIDGVHFEKCPVLKNGREVPGFCYLKVTDSKSTVQRKWEQLWKKEVFIIDDDEIYLSSKALHLKVFQSLIDKSFPQVKQRVTENEDFTISRKSKAPAITITIEMSDAAYNDIVKEAKRKPQKYANKIGVDIILALRVETDRETEFCGRKVNAPVHAICKWKEEESAKALHFADQEKNWLLNSVAYERFIFDVARNVTKQQYIFTALRILKTYLTKVKEDHIDRKSPPPQICTVLQSYHLKQITCYLILYTCYKYKHITIDGTQKALTYLVCLLEKCLELEKLPHFFYSNPSIVQMFDDYPAAPCNDQTYRYDMLMFVVSKKEALESLRKMMNGDLQLCRRSRQELDLNLVLAAFEDDVSYGDYI
ncbi:Mitochondrial fission 1 protein [Mactra antiquata]